MSDTMEEGVIVEWLKKEGDEVKPGDVLAEVETDKATMELENYHEGFLLHIGVESGPVPVNGILAVIGEKDEDFKELLEKERQNGTKDSAADIPAAEEAQEEVTQSTTETLKPAVQASPSNTDSDERIKASPLAKALAKEAGLDLSAIKGSGTSGRIIKKDIEEAIESGGSVSEVQTVTTTTVYAPDEAPIEIPVSQMRKTIAKRLGESKFSAPHFYLTVDINMDRAVEARNSVKESSGIKVSYNDLVIKACAIALRTHPQVNSSWQGDKIIQNRQIHIGVAVAVDEGLLVPVVRNTDYKTLTQINQEVKDLATKAKNKKLQLPEMQGNTFTISNLGMFGIEEFTAIINPPDACIMAIGSILKKPVVRGDELVVGHQMKVTLSCDHRVVDGATGAKFLQTFKSLMEEPLMMLV